MTDSRIEQLELKVDRFTDLFSEVITNQRLMQQELSVLSETLTKVNDMKLVQVQCSANTTNRLDHLELDTKKREHSIDLLRKECEEDFKMRDKYLLGFGISLFLMLLAPIIRIVGGVQ